MSLTDEQYKDLIRPDVPVIERDEVLEQQPVADQIPDGQRVDISELLIAMKNAIERMSVHNQHRGIMVTAGSVIIHLITENRKLAEICEGYYQAHEAELASRPTAPPDQPLVSLA